MSRRVSARVVLLDEDGCVLLFCGSDPAHEDGSDNPAPHWWFTVGGGVQPGETLPQRRCARWTRRRGCGSIRWT